MVEWFSTGSRYVSDTWPRGRGTCRVRPLLGPECFRGFDLQGASATNKFDTQDLKRDSSYNLPKRCDGFKGHR